MYVVPPPVCRSRNLSKIHAVSLCLVLQNFAKPNQLLKFGPNFEAENFSRFWSCRQLDQLNPAVDSFDSWKPALNNVDGIYFDTSNTNVKMKYI